MTCDHSDECSPGIGIPSGGCVAHDYFERHCPLQKGVNVATLHACPMKDKCSHYREKVVKKEIGLD